MHQRSIRTSAAHSPTIAHVPGPSAIGRGVVAWISATTMPFAMPLGNTIHDVCGHVMAKLHIIPINIHEVTSGCYKLTSALVPHYGATPLTYPRPPPVHFRTSHYSSVRVFVNRYPHYVTMSSHCVHTLYSSVRVFVPPSSHFVLFIPFFFVPFSFFLCHCTVVLGTVPNT